MRWRWKRQKIQTDTSDNDLLLLQKIQALEDVLSEAQSLLVDVKGLLAESKNGGGRKEKSEEEAVRKWQKQHKVRAANPNFNFNPKPIAQHNQITLISHRTLEEPFASSFSIIHFMYREVVSGTPEFNSI